MAAAQSTFSDSRWRALIGGSDAYCSYLFLSWLPSYLQTARHLSLGTTSLYTAVPYATAFVISISVAQISDRFLKGSGVDTGRRRFFIAGSPLTAAALIASVPFVDSVSGPAGGMIAVAIGHRSFAGVRADQRPAA